MNPGMQLKMMEAGHLTKAINKIRSKKIKIGKQGSNERKIKGQKDKGQKDKRKQKNERKMKGW
jgi:hypothetical protein